MSEQRHPDEEARQPESDEPERVEDLENAEDDVEGHWFALGNFVPSTPQKQSGGGGKPGISDFSVTKYTDKSSPIL